ncbi:MAG: serine protease, partial [Ramlibacter sp.]
MLEIFTSEVAMLKLQFAFFWFWAAVTGAAFAQAPPTAQATIEALTRANAAVVGVQVTASEGARSAESLGRKRSGSGVVIGSDGLVLTIGYLLLEADTVQIVTQDSKTVPARMVAYDLATGFGLLRPLLPLTGIAPVPLGSLSGLATGEALMASVGGDDGGVAMTQLVSKRPFSGYWEYHI